MTIRDIKRLDWMAQSGAMPSSASNMNQSSRKGIPIACLHAGDVPKKAFGDSLVSEVVSHSAGTGVKRLLASRLAKEEPIWVGLVERLVPHGGPWRGDRPVSDGE